MSLGTWQPTSLSQAVMNPYMWLLFVMNQNNARNAPASTDKPDVVKNNPSLLAGDNGVNATSNNNNNNWSSMLGNIMPLIMLFSGNFFGSDEDKAKVVDKEEEEEEEEEEDNYGWL